MPATMTMIRNCTSISVLIGHFFAAVDITGTSSRLRSLLCQVSNGGLGDQYISGLHVQTCTWIGGHIHDSSVHTLGDQHTSVVMMTLHEAGA